MKILLILLSAISLLLNKENNDEMRYKEAYSYITHSPDVQENLQNLFGDSLSIWVSDEVLSFSYWPFERNVVEFKYENYNDSIKTVLIDLLECNFPASEPLQMKRKYLTSFNNGEKGCLLLFFSNINYPWLSAEIFRYDNRFSKNYHEAIKMPANVLHILLYFEKEEIKNAFFAKGSRH